MESTTIGKGDIYKTQFGYGHSVVTLEVEGFDDDDIIFSCNRNGLIFPLTMSDSTLEGYLNSNNIKLVSKG